MLVSLTGLPPEPRNQIFTSLETQPAREERARHLDGSSLKSNFKFFAEETPMLRHFIQQLLHGNHETLPQAETVPPRPARGPGRRPVALVSVSPKHRMPIIAALEANGVIVQATSTAENISSFARPDLVVCEFDDEARTSRLLEMLQRIMYRGWLQPVGSRANLPSRFPDGVLALPPLAAPVPADAIRNAVETAGLARTPHGEPAVRLSVAFQNRWLEFLYQPQVDLKRRMLTGIEVLAHIRHPTAGLLTPASFLPQADHVELRRLGIASIRTALSGWEPFRRLGFNVRFSVATPLAVLDRPALADLLRAWRPVREDWPGLVLEMKAPDVVAALPEVRAFARQVRDGNIHLSLDSVRPGDLLAPAFGTLPFSEIKLWRTRLLRAREKPAMAEACRGLAAFAHGRGAHASVAGLERAGELDWAMQLGFDLGQGNLLGPAMTRTGLMTLMQRRATTRSQQQTDASPACLAGAA
jgi:EAL domain-containing protein (putative c-di-GMP-specific phosphodiesterase class I)